MMRELLSSWVTLPVYRDTILLNRLEKGEEGERGERVGRGGGGEEGEGEGVGEDMEKISDSVQKVAGVIKV